MSNKKSFTRSPWFLTAEKGDGSSTRVLVWKDNERYKVLRAHGSNGVSDIHMKTSGC